MTHQACALWHINSNLKTPPLNQQQRQQALTSSFRVSSVRRHFLVCILLSKQLAEIPEEWTIRERHLKQMWLFPQKYLFTIVQMLSRYRKQMKIHSAYIILRVSCLLVAPSLDVWQYQLGFKHASKNRQASLLKNIFIEDAHQTPAAGYSITTHLLHIPKVLL